MNNKRKMKKKKQLSLQVMQIIVIAAGKMWREGMIYSLKKGTGYLP
jgi:hypothetical protein